MPAVNLVVFSLGHQRFGLPLPAVHRCLRVVAITPLPEAPPIVLGVVDLAGTVVPVIDTRKRFALPSRALTLSDHLVIATTGRRTVALLVDETHGVLEASADSHAAADEILPGLDLFDGAITREDGLILIHDLARLLSLDDEAAIDRALAPAVNP